MFSLSSFLSSSSRSGGGRGGARKNSHRHFLAPEARARVCQVGRDRHVDLLAVVGVPAGDRPVREHRRRGDGRDALRRVERGDVLVHRPQRRHDARGGLRLRRVAPARGLRVGSRRGHELGELLRLGGLEGLGARGVQGGGGGGASARRRGEAGRGGGERRGRPSPRRPFLFFLYRCLRPRSHGHPVEHVVRLRLRRRQRRRLGVVVLVTRRELPRGWGHPVRRRGRLRLGAQRRRHGHLVSRGRVTRLREGPSAEELPGVGGGLEGVGAGERRGLARGERTVCRDGRAHCSRRGSRSDIGVAAALGPCERAEEAGDGSSGASSSVFRELLMCCVWRVEKGKHERERRAGGRAREREREGIEQGLLLQCNFLFDGLV